MKIIQAQFYQDIPVSEVLSEQTLLTVLQADDTTYDTLLGESERLVEILMTRPIKEEDLEEIREQAGIEANRSSLKNAYRDWVTVILQNTIRPSLVLNQDATDQLVVEAQNKVLPVERTIKQGQVIVRKGDPVTAESLEILRQLGLLQTKSAWVTLAGLAILVLAVMAVCIISLRQYYPQIMANERLTVLLCLLVIITCWWRAWQPLISVTGEASSTISYLIPMAAV